MRVFRESQRRLDHDGDDMEGEVIIEEDAAAAGVAPESRPSLKIKAPGEMPAAAAATALVPVGAATAAGNPGAGRVIMQGEHAVLFGSASYAGGADVYNFVGGTTVAVGGRRAGRPPGCWDIFDAVLNVTLDEYAGMGKYTIAGGVNSVLKEGAAAKAAAGAGAGAGATEFEIANPRGGEGGGGYRREYMHMPVAEGKRDKRELERQIPAALRFAYSQLIRGRKLVVHCAQGMDRSVGVVVAILATFYAAHGRGRESGGNDDSSGGRSSKLEFQPGDAWASCWNTWTDEELQEYVCSTCNVNKHTIQHCLLWVSQARPCASPSRHTLKKLNRFFMTEMKPNV